MNREVQKKLDELYKQYSKNLPGKISSIELRWNELLQNWSIVEFQDFHREIHSLCGSAGTYGYSELSIVARQMEVFLKTFLQSQLMSSSDKKQVTIHLEKLKATFKSCTSDTPLLDPHLPQSVENGTVYMLVADERFVQKMNESLEAINYQAYSIQDMITLKMAVKEKTPAALIIETQFLKDNGTEILLDFQKEQISPIPLFCILPNGELLPRLEAVRAGCQGFFQKPVDVGQLTKVLNYKYGVTSGSPYRILIIDDSEPLAEYYKLILNQAGMQARAITNPLLLLEELVTFQPDLLVMDVYMPECTGFELAAVLRLENSYTKIPIIFLSTEEDKDKKLFAISLGGDDFLTKPISPQHLISAVKSRSKRASILNYFMITDSLTGLLNHSSILKQLDIQIAQAKKNQTAMSFIMIDIDHFKKVNDTYGHPVGDEVIQKLSSLLLAQLRRQDSVGRYGGEEFALILPSANFENAEKIVNNLRVQFSQYIFAGEKNKFSVTFSAGISSFDGTNTKEQIIEQADQALYQAKLKGRNRVILYRT